MKISQDNTFIKPFLTEHFSACEPKKNLEKQFSIS